MGSIPTGSTRKEVNKCCMLHATRLPEVLFTENLWAINTVLLVASCAFQRSNIHGKMMQHHVIGQVTGLTIVKDIATLNVGNPTINTHTFSGACTCKRTRVFRPYPNFSAIGRMVGAWYSHALFSMEERR